MSMQHPYKSKTISLLLKSELVPCTDVFALGRKQYGVYVSMAKRL